MLLTELDLKGSSGQLRMNKTALLISPRKGHSQLNMKAKFYELKLHHPVGKKIDFRVRLGGCKPLSKVIW
jgi:hypothetical protein